MYVLDPLDSCTPNPCQNGGTCSSSSGGVTCSCASGYTGDNCSITSSSKLQAPASQEKSSQTSVEYSSQLFQQHSVVTTTQAQQQQFMELSTQIQSATQQISLPYLKTLQTTHPQQQQSVGTSSHTPVPPQPSGSYPFAPLATLQPSPTTSKEELKFSSPSQPQQQQNQSNYPYSQATKPSSVSHVTLVMNGSSISPGIEDIEYLYYLCCTPAQD